MQFFVHKSNYTNLFYSDIDPVKENRNNSHRNWGNINTVNYLMFTGIFYCQIVEKFAFENFIKRIVGMNIILEKKIVM